MIKRKHRLTLGRSLGGRLIHAETFSQSSEEQMVWVCHRFVYANFRLVYDEPTANGIVFTSAVT